MEDGYPPKTTFARKREAHLQAEARTWDTAEVEPAQPGDIPIIDISNLGGENEAEVVEQLGAACRNVGFYSLIGHGIAPVAFEDVFTNARRFHALPLSKKMALAMDRGENQGENRGENQQGAPAGTGYLPVLHKKLPRRNKGNSNEAFIVKRDKGLSFADNPWPEASDLPGFQASVLQYAARIEALALRLLPLYAQALGMPRDFFAPGFRNPLLRLRLTHYPGGLPESSPFGIAPHVDTTFFTLLAQDKPGLAVFSEKRKCWIAVPMIANALVVNTGELLKQWSNDEFISVKHFANHAPVAKEGNTNSAAVSHSRYSVPLFFNATSDYPMECLPSCCGPDRPPRYPTISYNQSQGVVQGE